MARTASGDKQFFVVTGMSGAGKSQALKAFEDFGFSCVDNLPIALLENFVATISSSSKGRTALGLDARGKDFAKGFASSLKELRRKGWRPKVVFLDAGDRTLQTRFSETRRRHPLGRAVKEAIVKERRLLKPIKALAGEQIDTSSMNPRQLREKVAELVGMAVEKRLELRLMSFGYKHGIPTDADIIMDVRFLPNPYWDMKLRPKTGLDAPVQRFLKSRTEVKGFLSDFRGLLKKLLPAYAREGKSYLTIAVGCTGGQHRSVFLAHELGRGFGAKVFHRDVHRRW